MLNLIPLPIGIGYLTHGMWGWAGLSLLLRLVFGCAAVFVPWGVVIRYQLGNGDLDFVGWATIIAVGLVLPTLVMVGSAIHVYLAVKRRESA